jgi:hypothetical protein
MKTAWRGILKIDQIEHIREGEVIWRDENIHNVLHQQGESFLLSVCFANDGSILPSNYYFGLDARSTIAITDTISSLFDEPISGGYSRIPISSSSQFTIESVNGIYRATSPFIIFTASGAGFGPVSNLFMVTSSDSSGVLISSASLSSAITLASGDTVNLKMSLQLHDSA